MQARQVPGGAGAKKQQFLNKVSIGAPINAAGAQNAGPAGFWRPRTENRRFLNKASIGAPINAACEQNAGQACPWRPRGRTSATR